tara:strand:+ start:315 stop:497 length:183 start_codon:yes stop_codon:yes gene_type:complete
VLARRVRDHEIPPAIIEDLKHGPVMVLAVFGLARKQVATRSIVPACRERVTHYAGEFAGD